jgi:hypothetical protein
MRLGQLQGAVAHEALRRKPIGDLAALDGVCDVLVPEDAPEKTLLAGALPCASDVAYYGFDWRSSQFWQLAMVPDFEFAERFTQRPRVAVLLMCTRVSIKRYGS